MLEKRLFEENCLTYYLGIENMESGLGADVIDVHERMEEHIRRLGELARIITDSGQIFITAVNDVDDYDLEILKMLNAPHEILVVNVGTNPFTSFSADMQIKEDTDMQEAITLVFNLLKREAIIPDYSI